MNLTLLTIITSLLLQISDKKKIDFHTNYGNKYKMSKVKIEIDAYSLLDDEACAEFDDDRNLEDFDRDYHYVFSDSDCERLFMNRILDRVCYKGDNVFVIKNIEEMMSIYNDRLRKMTKAFVEAELIIYVEGKKGDKREL